MPQEMDERMSANHFNNKHSFSIGMRGGNLQNRTVEKLTSVNDPMNIVQVRQPLQHSQGDLPHNVNVDGSNPPTNPVQRSLIHKLHADVNVGIRVERAAERNGVRGIVVLHDLQFSQDLLPHRRFCVDQHDLFVRQWFVSERMREQYRGQL